MVEKGIYILRLLMTISKLPCRKDVPPNLQPPPVPQTAPENNLFPGCLAINGSEQSLFNLCQYDKQAVIFHTLHLYFF